MRLFNIVTKLLQAPNLLIGEHMSSLAELAGRLFNSTSLRSHLVTFEVTPEMLNSRGMEAKGFASFDLWADENTLDTLV